MKKSLIFIIHFTKPKLKLITYSANFKNICSISNSYCATKTKSPSVNKLINIITVIIISYLKL